MRAIHGNAFAKVNLTLDILDRRPDGYHDIRSIMQTVSLSEELIVSITNGSPGIHLKVAGQFASEVPVNENNLVVRAARLVLEAGGIDPNSVCLEIYLEKEIPVQAGLGGASSDAAAALLLTNLLYDLTLPKETLLHLAAQLGSDVPFFVNGGGTCLVEGRGERLTKLEPPFDSRQLVNRLVVCKPNASVSTVVAYGELDRKRQAGGPPPGDSTSQWLQRHTAGQSDLPLSNDFQSVIFDLNPEVARAADIMRAACQANDIGPLLCGSGAALFVLAATPASAKEIAVKVHQQIDAWVAVASTVPWACGIGIG